MIEVFEAQKEFIHLHVHSDYSLYDGFQKIADIVNRVSFLNMPGVAITDHGKVGSFIKFYKACKEKKIKPIFGIELYLCHNLEGNNKEKRYHLTVLAKNNIGYKNILELSSKSHKHIVKVFRNEIPRVNFEMLKEHGEGLVILSGCIASEYSDCIVAKQDIEAAKRLAKQYKDIWGEDYYLEVMYTNYEPQLNHIKATEKISKELDIKICATNDAHYATREDAEFQAKKISLSRNRPYFVKENEDEYYIKSFEEMNLLFKGKREQYLKTSVDIFEKCNVNLELGKGQLPDFTIPKNNEEFNKRKMSFNRKTDEEAYLIFLAEKGLQKLGLWEDSVYKERLYKELETILFTGFTKYFLVVEDYCRFSHENDIMISRGRGSGAGSLVLKCLGVISTDPVKRQLSMDRFLFSEASYRAKIEDFFSHKKREENMHGDQCVCKKCIDRKIKVF